jgi:cytochrome c
MRHGPQPLSIGNFYLNEDLESPWSLIHGQDSISITPNYKGHVLDGDHVSLKYELVYGDNRRIIIEETPETEILENGNLVFYRSYKTQNVPDDYSVQIIMHISSITSPRDVETNGKWMVENSTTALQNNVEILSQSGKLKLVNNGTTDIRIALLDRPTIANPNNKLMEEEDEEWEKGEQLIAQSDCKTCHNPTVKTIGPAYKAIADQYPTTDEIVDLLANKIIKGGGGIWGSQVMSAHPDLDPEDAKEMAKYILDMDKDDTGLANESGDFNADEYLEGDTTIVEDELLLGALVKAYRYKTDLVKIPQMKGKTPFMGGVLANFDNISNNDFTGLDDNFSLLGEAYLFMDKDDIITLRVWSDDGSRVSINGQVVIDHDGSHGTSYKETKLALKAGYYPLKLEYFNGAGGKFLSLNWKRSGQEAFEVIPPHHYYHTFAAQKQVTSLSLPMSVQRKIPGDQFAVQEVHPSFDLTQARPDNFTPKVGGMDFLDDGRLVISRWDAEGGVYILDGVETGDPEQITAKRIAFGLAEPLGLKVVDNEIYVMQKQELTKLVDLDGDEIIDEYQTICDDWTVSANFHEFGFGLEYKDGYFYAALAIAILPGGASANPQVADRGKAIRVNKATGEIEFIAHGLRTPNGIGKGFNDEIFIADNQGDWLPSSKILHVRENAWFGSRAVNWEGTEGLKETPPVVWLPQDEIGNSPSTPSYLNVGPYQGQMIHGEVTNGGVKRVFVEEVSGELQGCVFRFIQGLEAGVNRLCWGPDGALYVGGVGNPGNWGHSGKLWYGLQRLAYNGEPTFEMLAVRAKSDGMEIEFTEPLEYLDGWDKSDYELKQWYYLPTIDYGGPKMEEESLNIRSVNISEDRKKVFLELDGMKAGHVIYIHLKEHLISQGLRQLWSTEAWYTLNNIPQDNPGFRATIPASDKINALNEIEKELSWELLFDGNTIDKFRKFKGEGVGSGWVIEDDAIHLNAIKKVEGGWQVSDGGDIITKDVYDNYELRLEWKIANCGNSGIIYHVTESDEYDYVWQTGPEMQVLDNTCHPDTRFVTHRAGDLYDMIACKQEVVNPAGEWNQARLISNKGKIEHWLNGIKVVEFDMLDDNWAKMISDSKFKDMPGFGKTVKGHIALQDHGDPVWFRNIKIRKL